MENMVDALAEKFKEDIYLDFTDEELSKARKEFEGSLLVKLVGDRNLKLGIFIPMFKKLWGQQGHVNFSEIDTNVLMASFSSDEDKDRALNNGPWLHNGWAVLVSKWTAGNSMEEIFSNKIQMVVQIHNLPLELRSEETARRCAKVAGKVIGSLSALNNGKPDNNVYRRRFHRFKIEVDLTKALEPGCFLGKKGNNPPKAIFRYEKLPIICFKCGLFDHETSKCTNPPRQASIPYDNFIRADYIAEENTSKDKAKSTKGSTDVGDTVIRPLNLAHGHETAPSCMEVEEVLTSQTKSHQSRGPQHLITNCNNGYEIQGNPSFEVLNSGIAVSNNEKEFQGSQRIPRFKMSKRKGPSPDVDEKKEECKGSGEGFAIQSGGGASRNTDSDDVTQCS